MKASISVSKNIFVPRISVFNDACLAVAAFLRQFTTADNDYAIRLLMDELTPDEARAEIMSDIANAEWNRLAEEFWSSGYVYP